MSGTYPKTAEEAISEGWRMVCVFPCKKFKPRDLDERILKIVDDVFYPNFTRRGSILAGRQYAMWVKGGNWTSVNGRNVVELMLHNSPMLQFAKELKQMLKDEKARKNAYYAARREMP